MRFIPRGLKMQLALFVSCILLVAGTISGWVSGKRQAAMLMAALRDHASSLTGSIGEGCAHYLLLLEYAGLEGLLHASLEDIHILRLQVVEPGGLVVGDAEKGRAGNESLSLIPASLAPPAVLTETMSVEDGCLIVWRPIEAGSLLGWLKATYDLSPIHTAQSQAWLDTLLITLFWTAGSAVLLLFMLRPLALSIGVLSGFARRLDRNKGEQITIRQGTREIAELAASLNDASRKLLASERQIMEDRERLRLSEEKYRSLIHKVQAAIVVHDGDGRILDSNPMAQDLLGLSADQLLGRELIDPQWSFLREDASFMPVEEYPVSLVLASRLPLRDCVVGVNAPGRGRVSWVLVNAEPEYDECGEIRLVIVSFMDITERRRTEQALREQEEKYFDLYENAPSAYFSVGVDGLIRHCNRRAGELLGCRVETLAGRPVMELYADGEEGKERAKQILQRFRSGEAIHDEELLMQKADGEPVWISLTVDPVLDLHGKVIESRSMVLDITDRKRAEDELKKLNDELEQRVKERTIELEDKNKELERMNRLFVGRELRMVELKQKLKELKELS